MYGMRTRVRSVIAEHAARQRFGHARDAASAGLNPQTAGVRELLLKSLRARGLYKNDVLGSDLWKS